MTAADAGYFPGLKILAESIRQTESWPLRCVDLGLTDHQKRWCAANGVGLIPLAECGVPVEVWSAFIGRDRLLWLKPWMVSAAPFNDAIWIDADAVVCRPLGELFARVERGVAVFADNYNPAAVRNDPALYEWLPVPSVTDKHVNAGVLGLRKGRDDDLVERWEFCVEQAASREEVREAVRWHDQGALLWALHATERASLIDDDATWNSPADGLDHVGRERRRRFTPGADLPTEVARANPAAGIVHYMDRPKLWELIDSPAFSIVVPTVGRVSLSRTLESIARQDLRRGDEVLIVADGEQSLPRQSLPRVPRATVRVVCLPDGPHRDSGGAARTAGMRHASGSHLLFMDDDDVYAPGAIATIRRAVESSPERATHIFRLRFVEGEGRVGIVVWRTPKLVLGNVGTPMFCCRNDKHRLGQWRSYPNNGRGQSCNDFNFISTTCALQGDPQWHEDVVAEIHWSPVKEFPAVQSREPIISCLCPTYNRAPDHQWLIEEAVESFLRQDHPHKELIVCNDAPGQRLVCDAPGVRVFNRPDRFGSLSEKLRWMIGQARGDLFCRWDDDDISLPWRLSLSLEKLGDRLEWRPENYWYSPKGEHHEVGGAANTHAMAMWRREAMDKIGGYPDAFAGKSGGEDQRFNGLLAEYGISSAKGEVLPTNRMFYLYRWGASPRHLSGALDETNTASAYERIGRDRIEPGEFELRPHWRVNYVQAVTR